MDKGKIIAFEGLDGCGKDTQIDLLKEYLEDNGIEYKYIPQLETPIGRLTRSEYLSGNIGKFPYQGRINELLFTADRLQYVFGPGGVVDSVNEGKIVILNRFVISGMVYALYDKGDIASPQFSKYASYIKELNKPILDTACPDITFYLKLSPHDSLTRIKSRSNRKEFYEDDSFAIKLYEKFEYIVHSEIRRKQRVVEIDGNKPINVIQSCIQENVDKIIQ